MDNIFYHSSIFHYIGMGRMNDFKMFHPINLSTTYGNFPIIFPVYHT